MKNILKSLIISSVILSAGYARAADVTPESKMTYQATENGGYEVDSESKVTTPNGTDKSASHEVDRDVKDDGTVSKTVESKSATDPKGLMNGKKSVHKTTTKQSPNGGYKAKTIHEDTNYNGTDVKTETETKVNVDKNGNTDTIVERTKKVDPKGLMNSTETKKKTVNGVPVKD